MNSEGTQPYIFLYRQTQKMNFMAAGGEGKLGTLGR